VGIVYRAARDERTRQTGRRTGRDG
jgi:hypothetical protein